MAAFLVFATLMLELVMLRNELTPSSARSLIRMDLVYGIAATVLLVVGFVRVFHTEKGAAYYLQSGPFLVKLTLFVVVGLLSLYPTREFLRWRRTLRESGAPQLDDGTRRRMRLCIHVELTLIAVIILMAIMMTRGLWYLG
jgi:putative membrane protein